MGKVNDFLKKHKMHVSNIDMERFIKDYHFYMQKGLDGEESTLKMIPAYIYDDIQFPVNSEENLVLDAGGTNLRITTGYYKNGKPVINKQFKHTIPGKNKEVTKDEFYNEIGEYIKNDVNNFGDIGYCFSFPINVRPDLDGEVLHMGKNLKVNGIVGTIVGQETLKCIKAYDNKKHEVKIINDTVATLLGGLDKIRIKGNYLGYILGTGTNICYFENSNKVGKNKDLKSGRIIINTETGLYENLTLGDFEDELLKITGYKDHFEKTCGGVYFADILKIGLNKAYEEGLISKKLEGEISLIEFSNFLDHKENKLDDIFKNKEDNDIVREIVIKLIKHSAKRVAAVLCGALLKSMDKKLPNYIILEGTTIKKLPYMKKTVKYYVKKYLSKENTTVKFVEGEDLNLKGSLLVSFYK